MPRPSSTDAILTTQYGYNLMELLSTSDEAYFQVYGTGGAGSYMLTFLPTAVYHVALTWGYGSGSSGTWNIYVNGVRKATGTPSANFGSGGASQWLQVGSSISTAVDYQIQNLAIWYYELTATDVAHLRDGVYNPGTLIGSTSGVLQSPKAWWLLGNATSGTPASGDNSFVDVTGNGNNFTGLPGSGTGASSSNASYAAPLVYTPLTTVTPYVAKSGQLAMFATSSAISTTSTLAGTVSINRNSTTLSLSFALSGTVSVAYNSTSLTTSVAQPTGNVSSFIGSQILIGADTSGTVYTITAGSGTSWTLSRGYQCTTNAVNSNAVLVSPAQNTLWIGAQIQISGDSSNTTYTIVSGGGTTFTISPAYAGSSNASGATATLIQTGAGRPRSVRHGRSDDQGSIWRHRHSRNRSNLGSVVGTSEPVCAVRGMGTSVWTGRVAQDQQPWLELHGTVGFRIGRRRAAGSRSARPSSRGVSRRTPGPRAARGMPTSPRPTRAVPSLDSRSSVAAPAMSPGPRRSRSRVAAARVPQPYRSSPTA